MRKLVTLALVLLLVGSALAQGSSISVGDSVIESTTNTNVEYSISLDSDASITISLESQDFDTYLEVLDADGQTLDFNDDANSTRNSELTFTAPNSGTYTILVRSFFGTANGTYTLSVEGSTGGTSTDLVDSGDGLQIGGTTQGTANDEEVQYLLALESGQTVEISLSSNDFDTYLEILGSNGVTIESDDDGGNGTNSRIVFTPTSNDTFTVNVRAFGGNASGSYTVSVNSLTAQSGEAGTISYGETNSVASTGVVDSDTSFEASAGDVINVYAISDVDEDIQMFIISPSGVELIDNDDDGEGLNPYIRRFPLDETGTYTIRVKRLNSELMEGGYSLTLEQSELLNLNEGVQVIALGDDSDLETLTLTVTEGTSYIISIIADEEFTSTLFGDILEEGSDYADTRFNISGVTELAFVYTAQSTGRAMMTLTYYSFSGGTNFTVELQKLN